MTRRYADLYQQVYQKPLPRALTVVGSDADVLRAGRGFMEAFDFTLQLAVGCPGGCLFCYVPGGHGLTPPAMAAQWGFEVRYKRRAIERFEQRLTAGELADKTLYWSGVTDPYALGSAWTRPIWEALLACPAVLRPRRVAVQTRFTADRDADLIAEYVRTTATTDGHPAALVSLSLGTNRNDLIASIERATPRFERRLRCIENLRLQKIPVVATLSPCLLWHDLAGVAQQLEHLGVSYLTILFLKQGERGAATPPGFLEYVSHDPELQCVLECPWQEEQLGQLREVFGSGRVWEGQAGFARLATGEGLTT